MEVLCACDQRYLPHAGTMLCSLLEHNSVSRIHLFYSSIAKQDLATLKSFVESYGSKISSYEMVLTDFEELRVDKWASPAVYYRLLAPRLLPPNIDKVLYLDSDIIVRRSIADLWKTDIAGHALAAVSNYEDDARKALGLPDGAKYFNSGVLLINLRFWRENKIVEHAISFIKNNPGKVQYWDQDALNATLLDQWVELPTLWNWQFGWRTSKNGIEPEPAVVHFVTHDKPWHWSNAHPFGHEYHKYRRQTPWRQYRQEGQPGLPQRLSRALRSFASAILPGRVRQWLRSHINSQA